MAADKASEDVTGHDYPAHEANYSGFVKLFKYTAIICLIIALTVVYIISN